MSVKQPTSFHDLQLEVLGNRLSRLMEQLPRQLQLPYLCPYAHTHSASDWLRDFGHIRHLWVSQNRKYTGCRCNWCHFTMGQALIVTRCIGNRPRLPLHFRGMFVLDIVLVDVSPRIAAFVGKSRTGLFESAHHHQIQKHVCSSRSAHRYPSLFIPI